MVDAACIEHEALNYVRILYMQFPGRHAEAQLRWQVRSYFQKIALALGIGRRAAADEKILRISRTINASEFLGHLEIFALEELPRSAQISRVLYTLLSNSGDRSMARECARQVPIRNDSFWAVT